MFSEYEDTLLDFLKDLSTSDCNQFTEADSKLVKNYVKSDGCTGVPDFFVEACREHDFYYRTHHDFEGKLITRSEADKRFRLRIQSLSKVRSTPIRIAGFFISWWRWLGVRLFAGAAWRGRGTCHG